MAGFLIWNFVKVIEKANTPLERENSVRKKSRAAGLEDVELGQKGQKTESPAVELEFGEGGEGWALGSPVESFRWRIVHAVVSLTVVGLGIASVAVGFVAEHYNLGEKVFIDAAGNCAYSDETFIGLGGTAAVLLTVAFLVVNVSGFGGYMAKGSQRFPTRWLISSWIWFSLAARYFMLGFWARQQNEDIKYKGYCEIVRSGAFLKGSVFAFVTVLFSLLFYYFAAMKDYPPAAPKGEKNAAQAPSHSYVPVPQSSD